MASGKLLLFSDGLPVYSLYWRQYRRATLGKLVFDLSRIFRALLLSAAGTMAVLAQSPSRLIVLEPGHFHATLLQKEMYPELDKRGRSTRR
jgi:hypothetical protein